MGRYFEALERRRLLAVDFEPIPFPTTNIHQPQEVSFGDVDSDGLSDVIVYDGGANTLRWIPALPGDEFGESQFLVAPYDVITDSLLSQYKSIEKVDVQVTDFDQDQTNDLLLEVRIRFSNRVETTILGSARGLGNGQFDAMVPLGQGDNPNVVDWDSSGTPDLVYRRLLEGRETEIVWRTAGTESGSLGAAAPVTDQKFERYDQFQTALFAKDLNGDQRPDIVVDTPDQVLVLHQAQDGTLQTAQALVRPETTSAPIGQNTTWISATDFDLDGDQDLVWFSAPQLHWFEQLDNGEFVDQSVTLLDLSSWSHHNRYRLADVDGDGDDDVVTVESYAVQAGATSVSMLLWHPNDNASLLPVRRMQPYAMAQRFGLEQTPDGVRAVVSDRDNIWLVEPSNDEFTLRGLLPTTSHPTLHGSDFDLDGDVDFLDFGSQLAIVENPGEGNLLSRRDIAPLEGSPQIGIHDLDGDQQDDIVLFSGRIVQWMRNLGGLQFQAPTEIINAEDADWSRIIDLNNGWRVADYDNDGDVDFQYIDTWHRNDGTANFESRIIEAELPDDSQDHTWSVDFDGDDIPQLVYAVEPSSFDENSRWQLTSYQFDAVTDIWVRHQYFVDAPQNRTSELRFDDLDGDGDVDIYFASRFAHSPSYWIEQDRSLDDPFSGPRQIHELPFPVHFAPIVLDVDSDGDTDLLFRRGYVEDATSSEGHEFSFRVPTALAVRPFDVNGDGLVDLVSSDAWYRAFVPGDLDNDQTITAAEINQIVAAVRDGDSDDSFDLNQDDRIDQSDVDRLFNFNGISPFDVNFDGIFDSSDLVEAFQAGKYNDETGDAWWSEGDTNGDGVFDSTDLVRAFQAGGYVA